MSEQFYLASSVGMIPSAVNICHASVEESHHSPVSASFSVRPATPGDDEVSTTSCAGAHRQLIRKEIHYNLLRRLHNIRKTFPITSHSPDHFKMDIMRWILPVSFTPAWSRPQQTFTTNTFSNFDPSSQTFTAGTSTNLHQVRGLSSSNIDKRRQKHRKWDSFSSIIILLPPPSCF